jgi:hypothetical protein
MNEVFFERGKLLDRGIVEFGERKGGLEDFEKMKRFSSSDN